MGKSLPMVGEKRINLGPSGKESGGGSKPIPAKLPKHYWRESYIPTWVEPAESNLFGRKIGRHTLRPLNLLDKKELKFYLWNLLPARGRNRHVQAGDK